MTSFCHAGKVCEIVGEIRSFLAVNDVVDILSHQTASALAQCVQSQFHGTKSPPPNRRVERLVFLAMGRVVDAGTTGRAVVGDGAWHEVSMSSSPNYPQQDFSGGVHFEFNLAAALFSDIQQALDSVASIVLSEANCKQIPKRSGVYMLLYQDKPVYVGKASGDVSTRLRKHGKFLSGRKELRISEVSFKCVCFADTWNPFQPEDYLVKHYRTNSGDGWNGSGFGSNEPGVNRNTKFSKRSFFLRYPLNDEWPSQIRRGEYSVCDLLEQMKKKFPFWFVYHRENTKDLSPELARRIAETLRSASVTRVPRDRMTARELLILAARQLDGWQATVTPSHMILRCESDARYHEGVVVWPASTG